MGSDNSFITKSSSTPIKFRAIRASSLSSGLTFLAAVPKLRLANIKPSMSPPLSNRFIAYRSAAVELLCSWGSIPSLSALPSSLIIKSITSSSFNLAPLSLASVNNFPPMACNFSVVGALSRRLLSDSSFVLNFLCAAGSA